MTTDAPVVLAVNHTALFSGAESVLLRLLDAASERGWAVVVACPDGVLAERVVQRGMRHLRLPDLMLPKGPRALGYLVVALRHARAARRLRQSAVHADLLVANGIRVLPTVRIARLPVPVAWMVHSMVDRSIWRRVVRSCAPAVDLALVASDAVAVTI
ncbi:MAG: glycosyltransferase, partial [Acidimicrobiales bacterium]